MFAVFFVLLNAVLAVVHLNFFVNGHSRALIFVALSALVIALNLKDAITYVKGEK